MAFDLQGLSICFHVKKKLIRHIHAGEIYGAKRGKWFVDRDSIDDFFLDENTEKIMVEKVLASFR